MGSQGGSPEIQVLLVEDVDSMRALVNQVLSGIPGVRVSGAVGTIREAQIELMRRRPTLVLLDEILPGESIEGFLKILREEKISVIVMTGVENPSHPIPEGVLSRLVKPGWSSLAEDQTRFALEIKRTLDVRK